MAIDSQHPSFQDRLPDWTLLSDCNEGERAVKARGAVYLPPTAGMLANGFGSAETAGQKAYDAYRTRALFHDFVRDTVSGLLGVIHRKPPKEITVPAQLEAFVASATDRGESLVELWRRVTAAQLLHGRVGLLTDVPHGVPVNEAIPYVAVYHATSVFNWDVGQRRGGRQEIRLVLLDESSHERQSDLSWQWTKRVRVLATAAVAVELGGVLEGEMDGDTYVTAVKKQDDADTMELDGTTFRAPAIAGKPLEAIPFIFVNTNDLVAEPDIPPFLGLAYLSMAIYRAEADYRQTLFMQGQATLVRTGATPEQAEAMTGVGAIMDVPMGGDVKYIGAPSAGISEQRLALENDKSKASLPAIQFMDQRATANEASGEALRVRAAARTATLASIQHAAAGAMRDVLWDAGRFLGLPEGELAKIKVEPNLEFAENAAQAAELNVLMDAVGKGLPLSLEMLHGWLRARGYTSLEYQDELKLIQGELTDGLRGGGAAAGDIDPAGEKVPPVGGEVAA